MLQIDYQKWGDNPINLRNLGLNSPHKRTRERFLALYDITTGKNAAQVSQETGRHHQTIISWVHKYNEKGSETIIYNRSGGRPPLFLKK